MMAGAILSSFCTIDVSEVLICFAAYEVKFIVVVLFGRVMEDCKSITYLMMADLHFNGISL